MAAVTDTVTFQVTTLMGAQNVPLITQTYTVTGSEGDLTLIQIPGSTTNQHINVTFPQTGLQELVIQSDQTITVKTNSSGSPTDTFTVGPGEGVTFVVGAGMPNPLSGAVTTGLYITNAGSTTANVTIRRVFNA